MSLVSANPFPLVRQSQGNMGGGLSVSAHNPNLRGPDSLGKAFTALESRLGADTVQAYKNAYKADILAAKPGEVAGRENRDLFLHHLFMTKNLQITESAPLLKALDKVLDKDSRTQDDIKVKRMSTSEYLSECVKPAAQLYDAWTKSSLFSTPFSAEEKPKSQESRRLYSANDIAETCSTVNPGSLDYYSNNDITDRAIPVLQINLYRLLENNPTILAPGSSLYSAPTTTEKAQVFYSLLNDRRNARPEESAYNSVLNVLSTSYNTGSIKDVAHNLATLLIDANSVRADIGNRLTVSAGSSDFGLVLGPCDGQIGVLDNTLSTIKISASGAANPLLGTTTFSLGVGPGVMNVTLSSTDSNIPASMLSTVIPTTPDGNLGFLTFDDSYTDYVSSTYKGYATQTPGTYTNSKTLNIVSGQAELVALSSEGMTNYECAVGTNKFSGTASGAFNIPSSLVFSSSNALYTAFGLQITTDQTRYSDVAGTTSLINPYTDLTTTAIHQIKMVTSECSANSFVDTISWQVQGAVSLGDGSRLPFSLEQFNPSTNTGLLNLHGAYQTSITIADGQVLDLKPIAKVIGTLSRTGSAFTPDLETTVEAKDLQDTIDKQKETTDWMSKVTIAAMASVFFGVTALAIAIISCCNTCKEKKAQKYQALPRSLKPIADAVVVTKKPIV